MIQVAEELGLHSRHASGRLVAEVCHRRDLDSHRDPSPLLHEIPHFVSLRQDGAFYLVLKVIKQTVIFAEVLDEIKFDTKNYNSFGFYIDININLENIPVCQIPSICFPRIFFVHAYFFVPFKFSILVG